MSDAPGPGWIVTAAGAIVGSLWMALRASVAKSEARLEGDLKHARDRVDLLERSEAYWQRKAFQYAGEIKDAAERRTGARYRDEQPTMNAILDLRGEDPVATDQRARRKAIDDELLRPFVESSPPLAALSPPAPAKKPAKR